MNKKTLFLVALLALIPLWWLAFHQFVNPEIHSFFPSGADRILETYTDGEDPLGKGNSKIVNFSSDSAISLEVIIGDSIDYPYAGFRFIQPNDEPFFDISQYDKIELHIDSTNATFFILDITTFIDGFSHFNDYMSFRHHTAEIFTKAGKQTISLPMDSIRTQGWWYSLRKISPADLDKPNFKKCHSLAFEINAVNAGEKPLYVTVSGISFINEKRALLYVAFTLTVLLVLVLVIDRKKISTVSSAVVSSVGIQGKELQIRNLQDEELDRLSNYLCENYCNPQLSIAQVSKETGVSVDRIPQILMRSHQMQYKQYLNTIRITEAKRLLVHTDRQISEISIAVGYNYPSTFNRIFKEIVGHSPRNFRKNN